MYTSYKHCVQSNMTSCSFSYEFGGTVTLAIWCDRELIDIIVYMSLKFIIALARFNWSESDFVCLYLVEK